MKRISGISSLEDSIPPYLHKDRQVSERNIVHVGTRPKWLHLDLTNDRGQISTWRRFAAGDLTLFQKHRPQPQVFLRAHLPLERGPACFEVNTSKMWCWVFHHVVRANNPRRVQRRWLSQPVRRKLLTWNSLLYHPSTRMHLKMCSLHNCPVPTLQLLVVTNSGCSWNLPKSEVSIAILSNLTTGTEISAPRTNDPKMQNSDPEPPSSSGLPETPGPRSTIPY